MIIGKLIKITVGKRHAWYETNLGFNIRKPLGFIKRSSNLSSTLEIQETWLQKLFNWIKELFNGK